MFQKVCIISTISQCRLQDHIQVNRRNTPKVYVADYIDVSESLQVVKNDLKQRLGYYKNKNLERHSEDYIQSCTSQHERRNRPI